MTESLTLPAERRRAVLRQSWSVGIATGLDGVSFGALSVAAGLSIWQTQALSAMMFTGGSQFAFVGIVGAGGLAAAPAAIATATMLSIVAVAIAAGAAASPPVATIPTKANWEPPVNISAESAWVCQIDRPAATERAPKLTP